MALSENTFRKFTQIKSLEDYEILTDTGWQDCIDIKETIPYQIYSIKLENGLFLKGADTHILFDGNFQEIYLKDTLNKSIQTEFGLSKVISLEIHSEKENMYDIGVNSENHRYYTNGILSHNTTFSGAYLLWKSLFNHDTNIGITAQTLAGAQEVFDRIQMMFETLPFFLQPGVRTYNRTSMRFHSRNKIFIAAPTKKSLRGKSLDLWFGDEFAFVENDEEFYKSTYNTIASRPNAQIILTSTPNGIANKFYKLFKEAVDKKNSYHAIHTKWQDFPGRDEEWKRKTIADTSELTFRQEHGTEFIGSSNTLININKLLNFPRLKPVWENEHLKIYEECMPHKKYILAVDVSKGRGVDYSTIQIIDVSSEIYKQVCVYRNSLISPLLLPDIIYKLAKRYNNGLVLIENNDQGFLVCKELHYELEYDNMFIQSAQKSTGLGIFVDKKIKRMGCSNLAELIENYKLNICDEETISELSTYEAKGSSFEAAGSAHDDLVSPLVIFSWFVGTDFYKNSYNRSMKELLVDEREKYLESALPPVGIFEGIEIPGMI